MIHAQPKASRTEFAGQHGDALKVRIAAPPSEGAANDELRGFLAERFHLPLARVQFLSGASSHHKRVLLKGVTLDQTCRILDVAISPTEI